jgi:hypothetical protein
MKFGLFYAGELLHAFTFGTFLGILFFGGWNGPLPWGGQYPLIGALNVVVKGMFFYWVIMWIKYTLMRIRIDHMLAFNWKFLTPVAFVLLMVTALMDKLLAGTAPWIYGLGMFLANILVGWLALEAARAYARRQRLAKEALAQPATQAAHH